MNEAYAYGTKQIYPQLNNLLQFKLSRIKEIGFSVVEIIKEKNE